MSRLAIRVVGLALLTSASSLAQYQNTDQDPGDAGDTTLLPFMAPPTQPLTDAQSQAVADAVELIECTDPGAAEEIHDKVADPAGASQPGKVQVCHMPGPKFEFPEGSGTTHDTPSGSHDYNTVAINFERLSTGEHSLTQLAATIKHEFKHTCNARAAGKANDPNTSPTEGDSAQEIRDKREAHLDMEVEDVNEMNAMSCCQGASISCEEIKERREKVEGMIEDAKESGKIDEDYDGGDSLPDDVQLSEGCCEEVS